MTKAQTRATNNLHCVLFEEEKKKKKMSLLSIAQIENRTNLCLFAEGKKI
jgi:hypothetical protein